MTIISSLSLHFREEYLRMEPNFLSQHPMTSRLYSKRVKTVSRPLLPSFAKKELKVTCQLNFQTLNTASNIRKSLILTKKRLSTSIKSTEERNNMCIRSLMKVSMTSVSRSYQISQV
jgi:hypothetical protein